MTPPEYVSYQLAIVLTAPVNLAIGKLGRFDFPAGRYVYTGSARRNLEARIERHLRRDKKLHWHIDYLTTAAEATVVNVDRFTQTECGLNQQTAGTILIPGFGASDCHAGCGSHLKYLEK